MHVLQLVGVHATSQARDPTAVEVFPSPPHLVGVAGAAAESFHPFLTVVHLVASGQVAQPSAQAVHVTAGAVAELKKPSLHAEQAVVVPLTVQVLQPAAHAVHPVPKAATTYPSPPQFVHVCVVVPVQPMHPAVVQAVHAKGVPAGAAVEYPLAPHVAHVSTPASV